MTCRDQTILNPLNLDFPEIVHVTINAAGVYFSYDKWMRKPSYYSFINTIFRALLIVAAVNQKGTVVGKNLSVGLDCQVNVVDLSILMYLYLVSLLLQSPGVHFRVLKNSSTH